MSEAPDSHELARQLAVLEERMNTKQAEYRSDLADLMREIASTNAETNAELQKQLATATDRMATTRWWQTAVLLGGMGIVAAVIIAAIGWMLQLTL